MAFREDPFEGQFTPADVKSLAKQDKQKQKEQPQPAAAQDEAPEQAPIKQKPNTTLLGEPADTVVINPADRPLSEQVERKSDKVVILNGRMNPVTKGHEENVNGMHKIANENNADHLLIATHSHDAKTVGSDNKNPLSPEQKLKHLKRAFPDTNITTTTKESPSIFHQMSKLHSQGYKHIILAAGGDRTEDYEKVKKYNGVEGKHGYYKFDSISVANTGERKEGVSGTDMRKYAEGGDYNKFKANLPSKIAANNQHAQDLFHDARNGMHISEDVTTSGEMLTEGTVSITSRMRRAVNMRKNAARMSRAREIARRRLAKQAALSRRAMKKAKSILRTRLAGSQGTNYSGLSVSQKIAIDKMVERRKGAIKRIATKIAPRIKGDEMRRLQTVTTGRKFSSSKMVVASYQLLGDILTEKEQRAIAEKAEASGISASTLLTVFNRGKAAWNSKQPPGKTPSQYAFDRLNSYINGGKAFKEDVDLHEQTKPSLRDVLAKGMHTARNIETLDPKHIKPVQTAAAHAANIEDSNDDQEIIKKRKRANIIRRKTTEYVRKVVEQRGTRDTTAPSLIEAVTALSKKVR